MLEVLLTQLAKKIDHVKTLSSGKLNKITKVDSKGIYVETEASRQKYLEGGKTEPHQLISFEFLKEGWQTFTTKRVVTRDDFERTKGRSSFLMAFFSFFPFVEVKQVDHQTVISLVTFITEDLPCQGYQKVLEFLEEVRTGKYDPKELSKQTGGSKTSLYGLKSNSRQDLRILGFIDKQNEINYSLLNAYSDSKNKEHFIAELLLKNEYFRIVLFCLDLLREYRRGEKKSVLDELGMLIVQNSRGENLMVDNVAKERTRNLLNWLESTGLIDEQWCPTEHFDDIFKKKEFDLIRDDYKIENEVPQKVRDKKESSYISNVDLVTHIHSYITSKGFLYKKEDVTNLFLSLKTKPFVILSGISGTGKTKMVQWFAESVGANEDNGQFTLIPIRPDWHDGSDLLGYIDIKGDFREGPLTTVVKNALDHPDRPYFVLLDEMNLARVEHYFSDILSVMESRKWKDGKMVSSYLLTEENAKMNLRLPNNLYTIGTVNMDETTHPFSKKVLDRANTIEFNQVYLDKLAFLDETETVEPISVPNNRFASKYLHLKDAYQEHKDLIHQATEELVKINEVLQPMNVHVGYRVRDEICFYLVYNAEGEFLLEKEQALDYCILQKILPRISGSDSRVNTLLRELYKLFTSIEYEEGKVDYEEEMISARYPNSARKVLEMLRRVENDDFTSFWIS